MLSLSLSLSLSMCLFALCVSLLWSPCLRLCFPLSRVNSSRPLAASHALCSRCCCCTGRPPRLQPARDQATEQACGEKGLRSAGIAVQEQRHADQPRNPAGGGCNAQRGCFLGTRTHSRLRCDRPTFTQGRRTLERASTAGCLPARLPANLEFERVSLHLFILCSHL